MDPVSTCRDWLLGIAPEPVEYRSGPYGFFTGFASDPVGYRFGSRFLFSPLPIRMRRRGAVIQILGCDRVLGRPPVLDVK